MNNDIIGLVILGILIIFIFFGAAEKFFRNIGIANWLAFLLVLALVIGSVVPTIRIGTFSMRVSGFLIPIAIMILFQILIGWNGELLRSVIAQLAVAAVFIAIHMLVLGEPDSAPYASHMILTATLITGFIGGIVAYLVGQTRMSILASTMGGVVLGDVILNVIWLIKGNHAFDLGENGVFNSIIIAAVFGLILLEVINAILRTMNRKRLSNTALGFETAEDVYTEHEIKSDRLDEAGISLHNDGTDIADFENFFRDDNLM